MSNYPSPKKFHVCPNYRSAQIDRTAELQMNRFRARTPASHYSTSAPSPALDMGDSGEAGKAAPRKAASRKLKAAPSQALDMGDSGKRKAAPRKAAGRKLKAAPRKAASGKRKTASPFSNFLTNNILPKASSIFGMWRWFEVSYMLARGGGGG